MEVTSMNGYNTTQEIPKQETPATNVPAEHSFNAETFVNTNLVKDESGTLAMKEGTYTPEQDALLKTEMRRRETNSSYSKERLRADKAELELDTLKKNLHNIPQAPVIDEDLKHVDPDAYIEQVLAAKAFDPYAEVFQQSSEQANSQVGQLTLDGAIAIHNQRNPDKPITPDMMNYDLPPRLVKRFQGGEISATEFFGEAATLLYKPKTVAQEPVVGQPNLNNVTGGSLPGQVDKDAEAANTYATAVI